MGKGADWQFGKSYVSPRWTRVDGGWGVGGTRSPTPAPVRPSTVSSQQSLRKCLNSPKPCPLGEVLGSPLNFFESHRKSQTVSSWGKPLEVLGTLRNSSAVPGRVLSGKPSEVFGCPRNFSEVLGSPKPCSLECLSLPNRSLGEDTVQTWKTCREDTAWDIRRVLRTFEDFPERTRFGTSEDFPGRTRFETSEDFRKVLMTSEDFRRLPCEDTVWDFRGLPRTSEGTRLGIAEYF